MEKARRLLERVTPHSTVGVTLLTLSVLTLIILFFVGGLHVTSLDGVPGDGASCFVARSLATDSNARLVSNNQNRTNKNANRYLGCSSRNGSSEVIDLLRGDASAEFAKSWERYADNRCNRRVKLAPGYVALLTRTFDCRWADNSEDLRVGAQCKVGQTLNIAAGLVEIAFACGAKAILEGPAVLQLESAKSGSLHVGKLTADVPDEVDGFTVHTPVVQLVSLCTAEPKAVAKLTAASNCLWAEGNATSRQGSALQPGQAVKLIDGLAEITFASGAKVILQGPADFEIESAKTAILHDGRMTAEVPDDLQGFKVRTTAAEILSLPGDSRDLKGSKSTADIKPVSLKQ
jgi:hypothetical protein